MNSMWSIDHDDASSWFEDTNNVHVSLYFAFILSHFAFCGRAIKFMASCPHSLRFNKFLVLGLRFVRPFQSMLFMIRCRFMASTSGVTVSTSTTTKICKHCAYHRHHRHHRHPQHHHHHHHYGHLVLQIPHCQVRHTIRLAGFPNQGRGVLHTEHQRIAVSQQHFCLLLLSGDWF